MSTALPTEAQREQLGRLIQWAFVEIRAIAADGRSKQASDLADGFHNISREMYGWGCWDLSLTRAWLEQYQSTYHRHDYSPKFDYVAELDAIFGLE